MSWTRSEFLKEITKASPSIVSFYTKRKNSKKQKFLILSAGFSGSVWLGSNLSLHKDIICSAGSDHVIGATAYDHNRDFLKNFCLDRIKSESDFFNIFGNGVHTPSSVCFSQDLAGKGKWVTDAYYFAGLVVKSLGIDLISRIKERGYCPESLIHDEIKKVYPEKNVIGNVHAYQSHQGFFDRNRSYFLENGIIVLTLIRNPILKFKSMVNYFKIKNPKLAVNQESENYLLIKEKFNIENLSEEETAFFWYVESNVFAGMCWEILFNEVPVIKFEDLKDDKDYFAQLVNYISGDKLYASDDYIKSIFDDPSNLNNGRSSYSKDYNSDLDYWNDLKDWQRFLLSKKAKEANIIEVFKPYYDLSFCNQI